jgi:hypothetical protein
MKRTRKQPATRPTGLCLDERQGMVVLADYSADGGFDIHRAVIDERRSVNVTSPELRTVVYNATAHSQFVADSLTAAASDESILSALIPTLPDDHAAANFTRAGDDRILLTQADELAISGASQRIEAWLETQQPTHVQPLQYALRIETRTRALVRTWHLAAAPEQGSVAFLVVGYDDYGLALWSEGSGIAFENEEHFESGANLQIKCRHAAEMLANMVGAATSEDLSIPLVTKAIISAPEECQDQLIELLRTHHSLSQIDVQPISLADEQGILSPVEQNAALAIGALLDDPQVPPCDLNVSLNEQLNAIRYANTAASQLVAQTQVTRALIAALIPIAAVLAFIISSSIDRYVERGRLGQRLAREEVIGKQLEKENADYESSKSNFATFQALLNNLISLRKRQPAAEQLLRDLNQRWPHENSWFVSEINVKGSSVEIKGKTRNQQAIATFAKSLEFSDGLFTNILAKNNVQVPSTNAATQAVPSPESSVIEFTVNATYGPLATSGKPADNGGAPAQQQPPVIPQPPQVGPPPAIPSPAGPMTAGSQPLNNPSPQSGVKQ